VIPKTKPAPYAKGWWSKELSQKHPEVHKLGRRAYERRGDPQEPVHKAYKAARNAYGAIIEIAKGTHWESFLQTVDGRSVWIAHRYASGDQTDGGRGRVPTLV